MVCADTFRAGAFDQLKQNATKLRVREEDGVETGLILLILIRQHRGGGLPTLSSRFGSEALVPAPWYLLHRAAEQKPKRTNAS